MTIRQKATYQGQDWWHWSVWLEGSDHELDATRRVTYHLHSTFPKPDRTVEDRPTKFRLDSAGWGEFTIRAVIENRNGEKVTLFHELSLEREGGADRAESNGSGPHPRVFLSYSALDERLAQNFREILGSRGIEVLDPADVQPGQDFAASILVMLRQADCLIALISETSGRSVMSEIDAALKSRTPVVVVELGKSSLPIPSSIPRVPLGTELDVHSVADSLVETVRHAGARANKR